MKAVNSCTVANSRQKQLYLSNKTSHLSYKGGCGVHVQGAHV